MVYTVVFMAAGALAVAATGTMDALQVAALAPAYAPPTQATLATGAAILGSAVLGTAVLGAACRSSVKAASLAYEAFAGVIFSLGLGASEMTRPDKVRVVNTHAGF